jgi:hypothetical protein
VYKRLQPETREKPPNFPPEIPGKSPTFSENFRKFPEIPENPGNRPGKIDHFGGVYKRLQPETPKKPPNFPPEIPGKSPTFSENFRKFPEIPENPGSRPRKIGHFWGMYTRLQPETTKKPTKFPPEILWKFPKSLKSRKFRKFRKAIPRFSGNRQHPSAEFL